MRYGVQIIVKIVGTFNNQFIYYILFKILLNRRLIEIAK